MTGKKLVLTYVDSLRTDMLLRASDQGRAPHFAKLLDRGTLIEDCVTSFPSVTPVASAEIATGAAADHHWISGMNWYHRIEGRYVEYGSSLEATRRFGIFQSLYDLVYNMNLAHLNADAETIFESLDDAGIRTASTPFLIYRGRHRHPVSLEGLTRRAIEASGLKLNHHTWGPKELFYGDMYASRPVPCQSTSVPGTHDGYAGCCAAELAAANLFDFLLLGLPDNDHHSHRYGPDASLESISKADHCFAKLVEAAGGMDGFLADHAVILLADHAHSAVEHELPLTDALADRWTVLQPSVERGAGAELAVSPTSRAAHVYVCDALIRGGEVATALESIDGVDLQCALIAGTGEIVRRKEPGPAPEGSLASIRKQGSTLRFRPSGAGDAGSLRDLRGRSWQVDGDLEVIGAETSEGMIAGDAYPDALARVWSALDAPNAGDIVVSAAPGYEFVDWGGTSHVGGGSHGSLHAQDSLGPLLFVGCGPEDARSRDQWNLYDVAGVIRSHFGVQP